MIILPFVPACQVSLGGVYKNIAKLMHEIGGMTSKSATLPGKKMAYEALGKYDFRMKKTLQDLYRHKVYEVDGAINMENAPFTPVVLNDALLKLYSIDLRPDENSSNFQILRDLAATSQVTSATFIFARVC